jgi:hypothetical protein
MFGFANAGFGPIDAVSNTYLGKSNYSVGMQGGGTNVVSAGFTSNYSGLASVVLNDVWGMAIDFGAGSIWIAQNNVWASSSNPATGSLPIISFVPATVGPLFVGMSVIGTGGGTWTLQPTAASQTYAAPAGFAAWN